MMVLLGERQKAPSILWYILNALTLTTHQVLTLFFEEDHLPPEGCCHGTWWMIQSTN
jgi:hypothetical protein